MSKYSKKIAGIDDLIELESIIKEAISFGSVNRKVNTRDGAKKAKAKYDGPLVTVKGSKRYIGDPGTGLSPQGFWAAFRSRLQQHVNQQYPDIGLEIDNLGVSRDLAKAADPGGNTARVAGSKHGAGMAQDVYLHTSRHGKYTSFRKMNPKLATDQELIDSIISFMEKPEQADLIWGGAFGSGKEALSKGEKPKGRGVLEFHHFEFKGSKIPEFFQKYEDELKKVQTTSSKLTTTRNLGTLYKALAEGMISKKLAKDLLRELDWNDLESKLIKEKAFVLKKKIKNKKDFIDKSDPVSQMYNIILEAVGFDDSPRSAIEDVAEEEEDDKSEFSVDIPEGTSIVHPLPKFGGTDWSTKMTSLPQASRSVKTSKNPTGKAKPHKGADFGVPEGTPLLAYADGTVITVTDQPSGAGYYVTVKHGMSATDGGVSGPLQTQYMHMSRQDVKKGDKVTAGQVLGLSGGKPGSPGAGSTTGPHLHFTFKIGKTQSYNADLYKDLLGKATVVSADKKGSA